MPVRVLVAFCTVLALSTYVSAQDRYEEHRDRERAERRWLEGRVVQVVDGDTCIVEDRDGRRHRLCLYGIDAPENGQPYWQEAREALLRRINNRDVRYSMVETDSEGRPCCNLYVGNDQINLEQVRQGFSWHHTEHEPIREFAEAERAARERHVGLWADRHPVEPWKYRREHREARREPERDRERD
jgi:endonuclease YncB( thermonuclease family)